MALRDQPYIPLYVQDLLTDEKLMECSAQAHGVYFRLLCILHKQEEYGVILLKQKDKQTGKQISDFALKLAKPLPFDLLLIETCIEELESEKVIHIEGDKLIQKRMQKDGLISDARSKAGKEGGKTTQSKNSKSDAFAKAKLEAKLKQNTEYEYEDENEDSSTILNEEFENKKIDLIRLLATAFNFVGTHFKTEQSNISAFVHSQIKNESDYEHFTTQYRNYKEYKKIADEIEHNFRSFLGTQQEAFVDSKWNSENWGAKIEQWNLKNKKQTKSEKIKDVFGQALQDLKNGHTAS